MQPVATLAAVKRALSEERLSAYAVQTDGDEIDMAARYLWNIGLASALQPSLHVLEVTLRNAIYTASVRVVEPRFRQRRYRRIDCWLDADPSFLLESEQDTVNKAKERLGTVARSQTAGHLIAKLGFGFWVALCRRSYDVSRGEGPRLWPAILKTAFPYRPDWLVGREQVHERLEEIRELRNRVAHHEPLWDRQIVERYSRVVDTIGWMNPPIARAVRTLDRFPRLHAAGPLAFRAEAESVLLPPKP